ncbi:MAG: conjugal transfer protein TraD [Caulobacteraceae bacterium]
MMALHFFNAADAKPKTLAREIQATSKAISRSNLAIRRAETFANRHDKRAWVMQRKERTRQLIELGGLVQKAGLIDLTDDDRAVLYGALLELADQLRGDGGGAILEQWRRRGRRAFDAEAQAVDQ